MKIYLSSTRLRDRLTLRVTIGNPRTEQHHVDACWSLLEEAAAAL